MKDPKKPWLFQNDLGIGNLHIFPWITRLDHSVLNPSSDQMIMKQPHDPFSSQIQY